MKENQITSVASTRKLTYKEMLASVNEFTVDKLWDQPAIYCGTYAKYNDGSIYGAWLDMEKFASYEEFMEVCHKLHADEEDPEFMFQDFQGYPRKWYYEGGMDEETFDKIKSYCEMDVDKRDAFNAYVDELDRDDLDDFEEQYVGKYDSEKDFAYEYVELCYNLHEMMGNLDIYFDYDAFARDLFMTDFTYTDEGYVFRNY